MTLPEPPLRVVLDPAGVGGLVVGGIDLRRRAHDLLGPHSLDGLQPQPPARALVLLDVAHALAPACLLEAALATASTRPDAAVCCVREVTDTLKSVDSTGRVLATVDRAAHREVLGPFVVPAAGVPALGNLLGGAPGAGWPVRLLHGLIAAGVAVVSVPAPPDLVVVTGAGDLPLVRA